eukprot:scaffold48845_cov37-Tisochrysis_lutea.AAC.3
MVGEWRGEAFGPRLGGKRFGLSAHLRGWSGLVRDVQARELEGVLVADARREVLRDLHHHFLPVTFKGHLRRAAQRPREAARRRVAAARPVTHTSAVSPNSSQALLPPPAPSHRPRLVHRRAQARGSGSPCPPWIESSACASRGVRSAVR